METKWARREGGMGREEERTAAAYQITTEERE
jgi:hypothetical protein